MMILDSKKKMLLLLGFRILLWVEQAAAVTNSRLHLKLYRIMRNYEKYTAEEQESLF